MLNANNLCLISISINQLQQVVVWENYLAFINEKYLWPKIGTNGLDNDISYVSKDTFIFLIFLNVLFEKQKSVIWLGTSKCNQINKTTTLPALKKMSSKIFLKLGNNVHTEILSNFNRRQVIIT